MTGLTFNADTHEYFYRGHPVPSVTQILRDMKISPLYPADKGWLEFGRAVHLGCERLLLGKLPVEGNTYPETSDLLWPYLNAFQQKVREYQIKPISTEQRVYNDLQGYCGTLDVYCKIFGGEEAILDFKTGAPPECTALQIAGYEMALNRELGLPENYRRRRRFALYLLEDTVKSGGRARMVEFNDAHDHTVFSAIFTVYKWQRRKGNGGRAKEATTA
jgi:hypothetical protein